MTAYFDLQNKVILAREALWPDFELQDITDWKVLLDKDDGTLNDGTQEQRMFVKRALSTPDFAILQGPPGSGKLQPSSN